MYCAAQAPGDTGAGSGKIKQLKFDGEPAAGQSRKNEEKDCPCLDCRQAQPYRLLGGKLERTRSCSLHKTHPGTDAQEPLKIFPLNRRGAKIRAVLGLHSPGPRSHGEVTAVAAGSALDAGRAAVQRIAHCSLTVTITRHLLKSQFRDFRDRREKWRWS